MVHHSKIGCPCPSGGSDVGLSRGSHNFYRHGSQRLKESEGGPGKPQPPVESVRIKTMLGSGDLNS
jgi:hypothetical protein